MKETGCKLENPAASTFRESILDGDWDKVDYTYVLLCLGKTVRFCYRLSTFLSFCSPNEGRCNAY